MSKIILFLSSFLLVPAFLIAQQTPTIPTIVSGSVRDAQTQEPLPFVNVYFVGTTIGVVADMEGNYRLETLEDVDSVAFSFLGYEEKYFAIDKAQTQTFDIRLKAKQNYLETATVQGGKRKRLPKDTAALTLWEEVIAHKHIHEKPRVDNVHYTDYTKVEFDLYSPRKIKKIPFLPKSLRFIVNYAQTQGIDDHYLPLMMKETITEIYKRREPKAKKHIIKADRLSGIDNEDISNFVSAEFEEINPYSNVITLADKAFIGPFATTGTVSYRYFLTDSLQKNGEMYYRLDFWGRSKQDLTFGGTAWIHKRTYGIEKIDMEISPHANINFIQKYTIQQTYRLVEDSVWLQQTEKAQALVTVLKRKKKNPMSIWIRKNTNHANLEWNVQLPDSIFTGEPIKKEKEAYKRPEIYWDSLRPDTLNRVERNIYTMIDSVKNSKTFKQMYWTGYFVTSSYMRAKYVEFGRMLEMVSWNDVEGVRLKLGARTTNVLSKRFSANTYVAYGTKDKLWKTSLGFSWNIPTRTINGRICTLPTATITR